MKTLKTYMLLAFIAIYSTSCSDEKTTYVDKYVSGIINQGNMSEGNGSISYYYEDMKEMNDNAFSGFGSIIQTATISSNGVLAVVANSPDKIHFINALTGATITPQPFTNQLKSPRDIALGGSVAYITNWGESEETGEYWYGDPNYPIFYYPHSYVLAVNLNSNTPEVEKKVACGTNVEGILLLNSKLFVATKEGVRVCNANTLDSVTTIIPASFSGQAMHFAVDYNGNIWASFPGNGLLCFNPINYSVTQEKTIPVGYDGKIAVSKDKRSIYTYDGDYTNPNITATNVYKMNVDNGNYITFITEANDIYGIGVNPFTGKVYTANPKDYQGNSLLSIYNEDGTLYSTQATGVGTSGFFFFGYSEVE